MYTSYGNFSQFGQIPTTNATGTDPVDGTRVSLSGPAPDVANATAVLGMLSGAVGAAKKMEYNSARQLITNARGMLDATGSLKTIIGALITKAESAVNTYAGLPGAKLPEYLTGPAPTTPIMQTLTSPGGLAIMGGGLLLVIILLVIRR